jgi:large subunit ribosomal protein L25
MANDILKASKRTVAGTNGVKKLRKEHYIPGVLYGHHIESQNIQILQTDFDKFQKLHGVGASLNLEIDGTPTFVLFKNADYNFLKHETMHVDFQALSAGEKIKMKVPITYTGKETIAAGLIFQELHHEVELQVLPKDIIETIVIDLSNLSVGDNAAVSDLDVFKSDAYEILDDADTLLYTITEPSMHVEEEETDGEVVASEVPEIGSEE